MRNSRVLRRLRAGNIVKSIKINTMDPRVAEIAAIAGFDVLWYDHEHVPTDWTDLENCVRAAKIHDADVMVRVSRGSYSDYVRPLELDAAGIMVPHVMGVEDARDVVKMTRFHPLGKRPVDGGNQDAAYCVVPFGEYVQSANEQRFVIVQIEDVEPLDQLEAIVTTPGIDIVFFGPGDFSQALGAPGAFDDPRIDEARRAVADACRKHGRFAGTVCGVDQIDEYVAMGYQFLSAGADVVGLYQYFTSVIQAFPFRST